VWADEGAVFTILYLDSMGGFKKRALALLTEYLRIEYRHKILKAGGPNQIISDHENHSRESSSMLGEGSESKEAQNQCDEEHYGGYAWGGNRGENGFPRKLYNGRNVQVG
jgi:hypothetical protein